MRRAELTFDAVDDLVGAYARGRAGLSQPSVSFSPSTLGPLIELAFQSSDGKHGPLLASPWLDRLTQSDLRSALARGQNIWFDGLRRRGFLRGLREAIIRALLYVGTGRAAVDERGFEALRRIRRAHGDIPLSAFKALVREQFYLLLIDTEAALAALPSMLSPGGISMFTSHGPWQIGHTAEAISAAPQEVAVAAQLRGWLVTGATAGKGAPSRRGPTAPRLAAEAAPFPGIAGRSTSLLLFASQGERNRTRLAMNEKERHEIEPLLPWHAAGTLSRCDADRVEQALADDPELARHYDLVRQELAETIHLNERLGAPSAHAMEKLFAAIDAEEAGAPRRRRRRISRPLSLGTAST